MIRARVAPERIWWIGGYALGLVLPPSWVGHTCPQRRSAAVRLAPRLPLQRRVHPRREEGFAAGYIDTVLMTQDGLDVLSRLPRPAIDVAL